ncbi:hypothetical protein RBU61_00870 [Tissierella sp. MB52-C2]|uniref:hypothetical protein n=1 Tax=Tissierella sp. MB52-C2 TaxID=3070999 RepID=UPI00280A5942|nr:hypothetical protein [Tissierella sp. MB52-C2]WMM25243.1 hypothetical protein RBU61_00870 [Tissierella sp. MB52-C2]
MKIQKLSPRDLAICRRPFENGDTLSERIVGRSLVLHSDNGSAIDVATIYLMNLVDIKMLDK